MASVWYQSIYWKGPALVERERERERDFQAKTWRTLRTVLISCVILCYLCLSVCLDADVLSGHNTTRDTRSQFQLAQPCTVPAHCTASTGWQPEHDTWLEGGGICKQWNLQLYQLKLWNPCHRSPISYCVTLVNMSSVIVDKSQRLKVTA